MSERHFRIWPKGLPRTLVYPEASLYYNLEVAATRWPGKPCIVFYDTPLSFREFRRDAEHLARYDEDAYRGESVKAVVVLKAGPCGQVTAEDIIAWCRGRMAAFKAPRSVEIADSLPKSATGNVEWRLLQEREG